MTKRKTHHVVPNSEGGWDVRKGGGQRALKHFKRKDEAEAFARQVSQNQGSELVVHGKDGRIQRTDSHGGDPNPPKDRN
jgi:hypothetical protein